MTELQTTFQQIRQESYESIDRLLRNHLDDDDYACFSETLEIVFNHKSALTRDEIIDAFCKTPDIRQHVSAFKAGVEYAESYHGVTQRVKR